MSTVPVTRVPLIANPAAGGGRCGQRIDAAVRELASRGIEVEVHRTTHPGHATELARRFANEKLLLCAGGDGTTYEVVNGLFPTEGPLPALGILPLGTGNSFLRDFDILTEVRAIDAVADGRRRKVDIIRADHTTGAIHYINLLSIGFTSEVGSLTNRRFKRLGPAGYAVATVVEVARLRHRTFPISLDGGKTDRRPCCFLSFNNSRCTGGDMIMAPSAKPSDGLLDVIRVGAMGRLDLLRTFPKIYAGKHLEHALNGAVRAAEVQFDAPTPLDVMVDGEVLNLTLQRLTVLPRALEILA